MQEEVHRPTAMSDSDFYRLSADDGPVWWLRGDPQCEPAWHPVELDGAVRILPRRFDNRARRANTTRRELRFVRVQQVLRVSAGLWDKLALTVPSLHRRRSLTSA